MIINEATNGMTSHLHRAPSMLQRPTRLRYESLTCLQTQNKLILFASTRISRGSNPQNTHFLFHSETSKMTTNPLSPETKSNKLKSAQSKWPKYTHKDPVWDVSIGPLILGHAANELSGDQKERQPFSVSGGSTLNTAVCHCSSKMQKKNGFSSEAGKGAAKYRRYLFRVQLVQGCVSSKPLVHGTCSLTWRWLG